MSEAVQVRIFNQTYVLRSANGADAAERLARLARLVDQRMNQIAEQITTYDTSKIAVLAALNIADELQSTKDRYEAELKELNSRQTAEREQPPAAEEEKSSEVPPAAPPAQNEPRSWFEAIFDADEMAAKQGRERRLSSQITAKLQSIRHTEQQQQHPPTITEDETN